MFQGDVITQLKLWLAMGIYIVPLASVLFGILLRLLLKGFLKISLPIRRVIWVQFVASLISWMFFIVIDLMVRTQSLAATVSGVAALFISAVVYGRMLKDSELQAIGTKRGFMLSAATMLIAILLKIPLDLLGA